MCAFYTGSPAKANTPKADSRFLAMKKPGKGSPLGLAGSQLKNPFCDCAVHFFCLSNLKDELATIAAEPAAL